MKLLIRADGNTRTGTGHVMRCIALSQAWRERGGDVAFALAQHTPALLARLDAEDLPVHTLNGEPGTPDDATQSVALAQQIDADWIAADGYFFDAAYQQAIQAAGLSLLLVDDYGHAEHYCADLVLNQNISASEELYQSREPTTRLLPGTRYVLLRREFWPWRGWQRPVSPLARRILITMGGGDPDNVTLKVLHALREVSSVSSDPLIVEVVVGGSNPHMETLQSIARDLPHQVDMVQNVCDMPERIARADIAIAAGGSTNWELAFLGLPTLAIILAENQRPIAKTLHAQGIVHNLGWHNQLTPSDIAAPLNDLLPDESRRGKMSHRGQALVDGEGCERIVMHMRGDPLRLRPVRESDSRLLWEWANEPGVRAASFSSIPIPWEDHTRWFATRYQSPNTIMVIALDQSDTPIGHVRFDRNIHNEALITISIDHRHRGNGYGKILLQRSAEYLFSRWNVLRIRSYIKQKNTASIQTFLQSGYQHLGETEVGGSPAYHLVYDNPHGSPKGAQE